MRSNEQALKHKLHAVGKGARERARGREGAGARGCSRWGNVLMIDARVFSSRNRQSAFVMTYVLVNRHLLTYDSAKIQ